MSDLLERLNNYNPPDRTIDEQRQIAVDIQDAANYITKLEKVVKLAKPIILEWPHTKQYKERAKKALSELNPQQEE